MASTIKISLNQLVALLSLFLFGVKVILWVIAKSAIIIMNSNSLSMKKRKSIKVIVGNEDFLLGRDLLMEILLRVPAKSLIRFKSVSKHWLSLITDPKFCSKHTLMNPTSLTLGTYFYYNPLLWSERVTSLSFYGAKQKLPTIPVLETTKPISKIVILHACNGLFVCSFYQRIKHYAVCNLTTQKFTLLPQCTRRPSFGRQYANSAILVFNPSKSVHYKVVLVSRARQAQFCNSGYWYTIDIYSSETGSWVRKYFQAKHGLDFKYKALFNEAIHWVRSDFSHLHFELDSEELLATPMFPDRKSLKERDVRYFGECNGKLFFMYNNKKSCDSSEIFIMIHEKTRDYCGWTLRYHVDMQSIAASFPECFQRSFSTSFVVGVVKEEDEIGDEFSVLIAIYGKIISCKMESKKLKVFQEFPTKDFPQDRDDGDGEYAYASPFMATLCPV